MRSLIFLLVPLLMAFLAPVTQAGNGGITSGYYTDGNGNSCRVDVTDTPDGPLVTVVDETGFTPPTPLYRDGDGIGRTFLPVDTNSPQPKRYRGHRYKVWIWVEDRWICMRRVRNLPPPGGPGSNVSGGAFWKPPLPGGDVWAVNPMTPSGHVTPDDEVGSLPH